jgi:hypothetical protein
MEGSAVTVDLVSIWGELMDAVGRASPFTRSHLVEAHPVSLNKNVLTVGYDPEFAEQLSLADNAKTHSILQTKLGEAGLRGVQVKFVQAERPPGWMPAASRSSLDGLLPDESREAALPPAARAGSASTTVSGAAKKDRPAAPVTPVALNVEDFKNDPLIRKALEIFKGQIVEVRT